MIENIQAEYVKMEENVREIVQMRKEMENVLVVDALQATHFDTVARLVKENIELQRISN